MPVPCVWPVEGPILCKQLSPDTHGKLCTRHRVVVNLHSGTWDCAWPGCIRTTWDKSGLCSFHRQVAEGRC